MNICVYVTDCEGGTNGQTERQGQWMGYLLFVKTHTTNTRGHCLNAPSASTKKKKRPTAFNNNNNNTTFLVF